MRAPDCAFVARPQLPPRQRFLLSPSEKQGPRTPKDIQVTYISKQTKVEGTGSAELSLLGRLSPLGVATQSWGLWQVPQPRCARGEPAPQPHTPPRPSSHLLPGLQVPLQRLLRELPDAQLALLAGHHDACPAEAHGHFHPGLWCPRRAPPNRCPASPAQPLMLAYARRGRVRSPRSASPRRPLRGRGSKRRPSAQRRRPRGGRQSGEGAATGRATSQVAGGRGRGGTAAGPLLLPRLRLRLLLGPGQGGCSEPAKAKLPARLWPWPCPLALALALALPWRRRRRRRPGRPQAPGWSGRWRRRQRAGLELGGKFCAGSQLLGDAQRSGLPRPPGRPGPGS